MACKGWLQIANTWYYFEPSGKLKEEELYDDGTGMFYLNKGGSMAKGLKIIKGKTHLFGEDGRLYRGYTIDKDGVLAKN
jgi:FOG: Glucan-binding domain (YG repeat)